MGSDLSRYSSAIFLDGSHLNGYSTISKYSEQSRMCTSLSSSWQKDFPMARISQGVIANAGFSNRQPRKKMNSRPKVSGPKGLVPKMQVGTSTKKRDQSSYGETEGSSSSISSDYVGHPNKIVEMKVDTDKEGIVGVHPVMKDEEDVKVEEVPDRKPTAAEKLNQVGENGRTSTISDGMTKSQKLKIIAKNVEDGVDRTGLGGTTLDITKSEVVKQNASIDVNESNKTIAIVQNEGVDFKKIENVSNEENDDVSSLKLKLEVEVNRHKQKLERLAEEKFSRGIKMFHYPEVVKPDQDIEVFLNRGLSTLNNELDVMIMGAFNDWKWKSFTEKLNKTHLKGDWWSFHLHIPKEGYKINFVFFSGKNVYDNNDTKDFCITVEGGMSVFEFEDLLIQEKRRELEKLAKKHVEREKQAEEQRKIEAEKTASEADRAQAGGEVQRKREILQELTKKAVRFVGNVWYIAPSEFKDGDMVRLYYNKSSGPLAHAKDLWIHGGKDNWNDGLSFVARLVSSDRKDGDWWYVDVLVPERAHVLDWVFGDGPPQHAIVYDNNHRQDFHAILPKSMPENLFWVEEEHKIYRNLQEERRLREEAIRAKAEQTAHMKAEMKGRTLKTFLLSQKHIVVYTEPLNIQAGINVAVFYNPANTVLNGKSEIWFRCSFNHWTHRMGPLPPQKMLPVENSSHVKVTVKVPLDAYMMDFVFSEREDGGFFDNKNGMDYHIPVYEGVVQESPMHIVHVAVEMAPIAKVKDFHFQKSYSWGGTEIKVWFGKVEGLSVYFLEPQNGLFWTGCIYGCRNDEERFGFFCHSALEFLLQSGFHPDIIHCHDWSSAPVTWLFKEHYMHYGLSKTRVVFTVHNLEFGAQFIGKAMTYADKATTVSHTYSKEISGNPVIAPHLYKFHGILNGIDPDIWDPYNDTFIPVSYTADNVIEGKRASKQALQQRLGLKTSDLPLVGIITRLTHQKGIHLIKHVIWRTLDRSGQVVLLGSAPDPHIQNDFVNLANQLHSSHGDRVRLCLTYDEPLSHLIYAGADFVVVPSIFEPCGLTQLIAMRYGSIPVVRKTGGLYDTVFDVDHDKERADTQGLEPNGFCFDGVDAAGVDYALNRAISAWYDSQDWFHSLCKRVMEQDWSWNRPALDYMELYHSAGK